MNGFTRRIVMASALLLLVFGSSGCRFAGEDVSIETDMSDTQGFVIGGETCSVPVLKTILLTNLHQYGSCYGIDLLGNSDMMVQKKYGQYAKQLTIDETAKVYTMAALADEQGITLTEDQAQLTAWAGEECYQSLSEEERVALGVTKEELIGLYEKYALAQKVYAALTAGVNEEVSDDEARVMQLRQILTTDDQAAAKAYEQLTQEAEFSTVAANYNEAEEISLTLERGQLPEAAETVAFSMEDGTYSEPVATEEGYYIFYCDSKYDVEATEQHKQRIVETRRREAFESSYGPFEEIISSKLNEEAWKEVSPQELESYSFDGLYDIYEKYLGNEEWIETDVDMS